MIINVKLILNKKVRNNFKIINQLLILAMLHCSMIYIKRQDGDEMKRWVCLVAMAMVCAAMIFFMTRKTSVKLQKRPESVAIMTVFEGAIKTTLESIGTAVSNESVDLKSTVTELVESIHFSDCEHVKKGQLLVQLKIDKKNAEKKQIEALLQEQDRELKRLKPLKDKKLIQTRDFDTQYSAWLKAKAQLEQIEAEIKESSIVAPFDGFLGIRQVSVGALVTSGTVIATLDDISKLKIDFTVPEKYNLLLAPQSKIFATSVAVPKTKFEGEVLAIVPRVSPETRSVSVRGVIDNSKFLLRPGMMLKININLNDRTGIRVPEKAVSSLGEKHFVFLVREGKAVQQYVITGNQEDGFIEIRKGLKVGDKIVTDGVGRVKDKSEVSIVRDDTQGIAQQLGGQK